MKREIFIIGSKGIPAQYGGYETFVDQLTAYTKDNNLHFHVSCMNADKDEFEYHGARCFNVKTPRIGAARAIYYDVYALKECIRYIKENKIQNAVVYILACRIGPFVGHYKKKLKKLGAKLYINPDGHEWLRSKWSAPVKKYWKISEKLMVKHADLVVCDSENIEKYIKKTYAKYQPKTTFIAYGADMNKSTIKKNDAKLVEFFEKNQIEPKKYYLIVGRFVPENNFETMIREFMKSDAEKDLVIISNILGSGFYDTLSKKLEFWRDKRVKFVGTVYDKELLKKIREEAYGYLHGHSVGGTNPSLIEALAATDLNLLYDVSFNHEVAEEGALYWTLEKGELMELLNECEKIDNKKMKKLADCSTKRVQEAYTWEKIAGEYEGVFEGEA